MPYHRCLPEELATTDRGDHLQGSCSRTFVMQDEVSLGMKPLTALYAGLGRLQRRSAMRDALRRGHLDWAISHQTSLCATGHKERVKGGRWQIWLAPHTEHTSTRFRSKYDGAWLKAADGAAPLAISRDAGSRAGGGWGFGCIFKAPLTTDANILYAGTGLAWDALQPTPATGAVRADKPCKCRSSSV